MCIKSGESEEFARRKIHPEVRREHVVKLAAAANATGDLEGHIVRPDGEMSAEITDVRSGRSAEVTVVLDLGYPRFAWTTDHGTIGAVENLVSTLGIVRHELVMRGAACQP